MPNSCSLLSFQSKYWYDYMEFEKKANELYTTLKNTNWDTLTEQVKMYLQEKLQWDRNRVIVWDPNRIEFQVHCWHCITTVILIYRPEAKF